jgi:hypothetical protein
MEAARPDVDAYALQLLQTHPFRKAEFFEVTDGGTRILPPLSKHLAETAPRWGDAVARVAEKVASGFLTAPSVAKASGRMPTPLPGMNRSRGRRTSRKKTPPLRSEAVTLPKRCKRCGTELVDGTRQLCASCLEEHRAQASEAIKVAGVRRLADLRAEGRDPAHSTGATGPRCERWWTASPGRRERTLRNRCQHPRALRLTTGTYAPVDMRGASVKSKLAVTRFRWQRARRATST